MSELIDQSKDANGIHDRFSKSMTIACLGGSFVHVFLAIFYFILKVPEMCVYSIVTIFLFLFWRQLFNNKWIEIPFILASLNAVIGIVLGDYFIGWESNFNVYFILLPSSLFLYNGWKFWKKSIYLTACFSLYLIFYLILSDFKGIYSINAEILKYLSLANTLSAVSILLSILISFSSSIIQMQTNLTSINQELSRKAEELNYSLNKEKELGQLKTSFVSTASHQFRTPLSIIHSNTELLEMFVTSHKIEDLEGLNKITGRIKVAISSMTDLMDDVLKLGVLNSGNVPYRPLNLDLVVFCEELTNDLNLIQKDTRTIDVFITGEPYKVMLDPKLLSHTLNNLINNAFKYSISNDNPQLRLQFEETKVIISIIDYGVGIPEEEQAHLFEPFFRANNVTDIKGTGLGLSIAKEYVNINKGTIIAKSEIGAGSCFEITFKANAPMDIIAE